MARYAIIEGGVVANLAVASEALAENWIATETAAIGWTYDGEAFAPPVIPAPDLEAHRATAMRAIVEHIDTITESALTAYPRAEMETWAIQKEEAAAVLAASPATLAMAPYLTGVCAAQFGPADDATRLAQVEQKAADVQANADAWSAMAAYVNGLRARVHAEIAAAADIAEIDAALAAGIAEGDAFKAANGL